MTRALLNSNTALAMVHNLWHVMLLLRLAWLLLEALEALEALEEAITWSYARLNPPTSTVVVSMPPTVPVGNPVVRCFHSNVNEMRW